MGTVKNSWQRIAAWYGSNVREPKLTLVPGATELAIGEVESEIGVQLPKGARESYRLHNGSNECAVFPYGFYLLPLEGVAEQWKMWRDHCQQGIFAGMKPSPEGPIKEVWWDLQWVPITHNSGGDHHCIDLVPAAGGTVGQIIKFSHEVGPQRVVASSLETWLAQFADSLEVGRYRFDPDDLWLLPVG